MKNWTKQEIEKMKTLINLGTSLEEIARQLNRSKGAISIKAYRVLGYYLPGKNSHNKKQTRGHWTREQENRLVEMVKERRPAKEMAEELNEPLMNIYAKVRQLYKMKFKDCYKTAIISQKPVELPSSNIQKFISELQKAGVKEVLIKF